MKFFYIQHHYLSILRKPSYNGELLAFFLITILVGSGLMSSYSTMGAYVAQLSFVFGYSEPNQLLFLALFFLADFVLRIVFRRPLPKLRYYALMKISPKQIASQYLITSLFGLMPYVFALMMILMAVQAFTWFGLVGAITVLIWFLANHFAGLFIQFTSPKGKVLAAFFVILVSVGLFLNSTTLSVPVYYYLFVGSTLMLLSTVLSYFQVSNVISRRDLIEEQKTWFLSALPALTFRNPILQLEWALLSRNRRTKTNLLFGLVSIFLLPFIIDDTNNMVLFIFFIATGFFIIQHGIYSLGWEGSYYDFLITNISTKQFIKTRFLFYIGSCSVGLILVLIPAIMRGFDLISLLCLFLYNVGVTVPLVLYRSAMHDAKIILTENSFMNYNGMMTGPIFVTSFLIMLVPLFIYGVGISVIGEKAVLVFALLGLLGLALFYPITNLIAKKHYQKKYHLSQSFKS